jgi:hypothetical protein
MSLKFAALGSLTVLSAVRASARADDDARNLGPIWPQQRIATTVSRKSRAAEPEKVCLGQGQPATKLVDRESGR